MKARNTIAMVAIAVMLTACASLYTATCTITQVVDAGMRDWAQLSVAGKTSYAIDTAVIAAHDRYRQSCGVAQAALIAYKQSGDQVEYVAAISAVRAAADGLFDIITPMLTQTRADTLKADLQKASAL